MELVVPDPPPYRERQAARPLAFGVAAILLGAGAAGLMYLLDPVSGRQRRSQLRERLSRLGSNGARADLAERVQAHLAAVASHPEAIDVSVDDGCVTLRGTVPLEELDDLVDEVCAIDGVREVHNLLQAQLQAPRSPGQH